MSRPAPRRLLTIAHSYVIGMNRRLAHELAVQSRGAWEVTAIAPARYKADLGRISVQPVDGEANRVVPLAVRFDRVPHVMWYSGLGGVMQAKWDVVHCWEEPYILAGAQIARAAPRDSRLVIASFQNISKRYPWPFSAFERAAMARADGWIAFGRTVHDTLASRASYAAKPSRIIPPGVDVAWFKPDEASRRQTRERLGWTASDRVVGFLGRFVAEKGIALLLGALERSTSAWRALFVGGGPLEVTLREFAARHSGRVHIVTDAPHADVPAWLNAMTLLCAPSQTTAGWREQFGRMLTEAMACGVPVIASDSGEIPWVVGDAGLVLGESDAAAWTAGIDRLLGNDALLRDYAARGIERANARFAWPVVARAHLDFFEALSA